MKINTRVRYAVRLMADIAKHGGGEPVPLKDVAERQGLSKLYLSQLSTPLRNASLLRSVWGNKGGYVLAAPPGDITLLDIIEAVDGPISVIDCVSDSYNCEGIIRTLSSYTLEDLIRKGEAASKLMPSCAAAAKLQGSMS
jgi:Rrf2 family cysteine metabolism transcriptional repressor